MKSKRQTEPSPVYVEERKTEAAKIIRLRALRLAKEAVERDTAALQAAAASDKPRRVRSARPAR